MPRLQENGGDEGDRTPDLCNAIAALSQLSYVPNQRKTDTGKWKIVPKSECLLSVFRFQLSTGLFAFEDGLSLLEKCRNAFDLVFGRKADREEIDLAAEAFVEI